MQSEVAIRSARTEAGMASKRLEKFAIRKRADAMIRDRRRIERLDDRLRGSRPPADMAEMLDGDRLSPADRANR